MDYLENARAREAARSGSFYHNTSNPEAQKAYEHEKFMINWLGTEKKKEQVVYGSMPTWLYVFISSFGPFIIFGALGLVGLGVFFSIAVFATLVYVEYFKNARPKEKQRYADPDRMEQYRKRYKQLTGKDYEEGKS